MAGYKGIDNTVIAGEIGYVPEDIANKTTDVNLGLSDILYPSQKAVKTYVDNHSGGGSSYVEVSNYASLPLASTVAGKIYFVQNSTGVWLVNRKSLGFYYSDGFNWIEDQEVSNYIAQQSIGNLSESTSSVLTIDGEGKTVGNATIQVKKASLTQDGYLSKEDFGAFSGGSGSYLSSLLDVNITTPTENDRLIYDFATSKWMNGKPLPVPAGLDHEIQYNNAGVMGADAGLSFDASTTTVKIGQPTLILPYNPLNMSGNINGYLQINMQNKSALANASTDMVLTADNGNDISGYVDVGINGSGYNVLGWESYAPNDTYFLGVGNDILINAYNVGKKIKFIVGGTEISNIVGFIDSNGMDMAIGMNYKINGVALPKANEVLPNTSFSGLSKITVSNNAPSSPSTGDLWCDNT